jgi:hypothetical protein
VDCAEADSPVVAKTRTKVRRARRKEGLS